MEANGHDVYPPMTSPLSSNRIILFPLLAFLAVAVSVVCFYFAATTTHVAVHVITILLGITILFSASWFLKVAFSHIEKFNAIQKRYSTAVTPTHYPVAPQEYGGVYAGEERSVKFGEKMV